MKLFDYHTYEDYGTEYFLQILPFRKYALLDFTLQWDDYGGEELFPRIDIHIGDVNLFGASIRYRRFYFSCAAIGVKRDLYWYRNSRREYAKYKLTKVESNE
jgi:hypothetical protein